MAFSARNDLLRKERTQRALIGLLADGVPPAVVTGRLGGAENARRHGLDPEERRRSKRVRDRRRSRTPAYKRRRREYMRVYRRRS